ncbi:Vacuolar morphogenesis protein 6 [Yarrowia sp. C11]|nr:Vacuolar morphogenesis protein 6 [Yarrowia sp. E02]KAG5372868.1 Vacuolar morphogenesis protein 6 [Yarrowia sp. C11]
MLPSETLVAELSRYADTIKFVEAAPPSNLQAYHGTQEAAGYMSYIGLSRSPRPKAVRLSDDLALLVRDTTSAYLDDTGRLVPSYGGISDDMVLAEHPPHAGRNKHRHDHSHQLCFNYTNKLNWKVAPPAVGIVHPYLLVALPTYVEVRNPYTTTLIQQITIPDVLHISHSRKICYIATASRVVRLFSTDYISVIDNIIEMGFLDEGISLMSKIDQVLLETGNESEGEEEGKSLKERKLRELIILKATSLYEKGDVENSMSLFSEVSASPQLVLGLSKGLLEDGEEVQTDDVHEEGEDEAEEPAQEDETPGEDESAKEDDESHVNGTDKTSDDGVPHTSSVAPSVAPSVQDTASIHTTNRPSPALTSLLVFLTDTRRKLTRITTSQDKIYYRGVELSNEIYGNAEEAMALVDTSLLQCYIRVSPGLIGPLLRVKNYCDPAVVKMELSKLSKWRELIDFYYGKGLHKDALELLVELQGTSDEFTSESIISYLQKLGADNIDLILEFSKAPIQEDIENGRELFLEDTDQAVSLPRNKVVSFLKDVSSLLAIEYLEDLTYKKHETTVRFHNDLALLYIREIENSTEPADKERFSRKLLKFLGRSTHYRPQTVYSAVPKKMYEQRAVLLSKMNQEHEALVIYVYDMDSPMKAQNHASDLYGKDPVRGLESLHELLDILLAPPRKGAKPNIDAALKLLSSQGSRMDPAKVLNLLSDDVKISEIYPFLCSQIRNTTATANQLRLRTSLEKVYAVSVEEDYLETRAQSVRVTDSRMCQICLKRLGHSVVSVFPDLTVVHYGCANAYQDILDRKSARPLTVGTLKE